MVNQNLRVIIQKERVSAMRKLGDLKKRIHSKTADVKINLAAIIDCMVVILAYLLISGSFIGLGVFDTRYEIKSQSKEESEPSTGESALQSQVEEDVLIINIEKENIIRMHSSDVQFKVEEILPLTDNKIDYEKYIQTLKKIKENHPLIKTVALKPHQALFYKDFMKTLETTKIYYVNVWMDQ